MRKLLKSKKALSPVVAAIILIAVTVAVSIAVAAWMGSLTLGFMDTKELKITSMTFGGTSGAANNTIAIAVTNPGTTAITVGTVKVNDATIGLIDGSTTFAAGEGRTLTLYMEAGYWTAGNKYRVSLFTVDGTLVGSLQDTA